MEPAAAPLIAQVLRALPDPGDELIAAAWSPMILPGRRRMGYLIQ
jgi:hypothetical protein